MSATNWGGPYPPQAWDAEGKAVAWSSRVATKRVVRWRVNGRSRRRQFDGLGQKSRADAFMARLVSAKADHWPADPAGRPVPPQTPGTVGAHSAADSLVDPLTFEEFSRQIEADRYNLWDTNTRSGHAGNLDLARQWLVYECGDQRLVGTDIPPGSSIRLAEMHYDDLRKALQLRRATNLRVRAANERRLATWEDKTARAHARAGKPGRKAKPGAKPVPVAEQASPRTVQYFGISLGMVLRQAEREGKTRPGLWGAMVIEAPPKTKISQRMLPSATEVVQLSEAIARLRDGKGDRYRALILTLGLVGPRPGEAAALAPTDIDWDNKLLCVAGTEGEVQARYSATGAARERNDLKARPAGDIRWVPIPDIVIEHLEKHFANGYATAERLFTSPDGTGPLNWGNITGTYFKPACEAVFGRSTKPHLVSMPPKTLRKAAITWWLSCGVPESTAAEWAGNSPETIAAAYAGVVKPNWENERKALRLPTSALDEVPGVSDPL